MTETEAPVATSTVEAGWHPDPLAPTGRRFWDGAGWTALVCRTGEPPWRSADTELSWTPALATLPGPAAPIPVAPLPVAPPPVAPPEVAPPEVAPPDLFEETDRAAGARATGPIAWTWPSLDEEPTLTQPFGPSDAVSVFEPSLADADPASVTFGSDAPEPAGVVVAKRRRRRFALFTTAVAAALVAGAAVAGAAIVRPDAQRPQLLPEHAYRDDQAGFSLRFPDGWHVLRRDRDSGIRFVIGARGAPTTETNTVSVVVGTDAASLPALHTLADQLTEALRNQLPGVRLDTAGRSRLADAPGFHFAFRDPDATPPTRIEQYVGRTTSGRPLTVTVTIREPRTAPTERELRDFVGSLDPS